MYQYNKYPYGNKSIANVRQNWGYYWGFVGSLDVLVKGFI